MKSPYKNASIWEIVSNKNEIYLLGSAVRFGHFQLFSGQFDGLNQSVTLSELKKANKIFQPNLGSGQTSQIYLDFNKGNEPVIKSLSSI